MYMSIKTCVYELIRIELSCGDMRKIIFSQDFLQYKICKETLIYSSEYSSYLIFAVLCNGILQF